MPVGVLLDGNKAGDPPALDKLAADDVARPLGCYENHVCVLRRHHGFEVDGEAVREEQRLALAQVWRDVVLVDIRLPRVRHGNEDDVGPLHGLGVAVHLEPFAPGHLGRLTPLVEADDDVYAAVLEVQRVRVALRTKAKHRHGFALEDLQVRVLVVIYFCCHDF